MPFSCALYLLAFPERLGNLFQNLYLSEENSYPRARKEQRMMTSQLVMCNEFLLGDILSRLPVKPLMRFKCVSKQWQSLIHKDRIFIDLHFTRSKASTFSIGGGCGGISLFIRWHDVFYSAKLVLSEGGGVAAVQREVPVPGAPFIPFVFGAINGLIALSELVTPSVCIFNPSTGQSTPWIQSMIKQQRDRIEYVHGNWYYFGYDPATMEHKVVLFWIKRICDWRGFFLRFQNLCEVMTVDGRQHNNNNLSWRRIDDEFSLPPTISPSEFASSLYANGSIYWLRTGLKPLIVEFNVGSEKFRVISFPNYIIEDIRYPYISQLIQIDGRLAVLAKKVYQNTFGGGGTKNNNPSMKMCVLYDRKLKENISGVTSMSSAAGSTVISSSGDFYWIEETFMMPPFEWDRLTSDSIQAVPGTDLLIIRSEREAGWNFYFYDWRKKTFSKDEQFFTAEGKIQPFSGYSFEYFVYKESLLPVI